MDAFTLDFISETIVTFKDEENDKKSKDPYEDNYYNRPDSHFATAYDIGNIHCFGYGKYLLVGVSAISKPDHYYYKIIDTETQKEVNRINRNDENDILYNRKIWQIIIDPKDHNSALFLTFKESSLKIISINLLTSNHKIIHTNDNCTSGSPNILKLTDSGKRVFISYQTYVNDNWRSVLYSYDISKAPIIHSENTIKPSAIFGYSGSIVINGESAIIVYNNHKNVLETKVIGSVSFTREYLGEEYLQYYDINGASQLKDKSALLITK